MFSRFCTKVVPCLLIVTLLIPSGLLLYPKKTHADSSGCLAMIGSALGISKVVSKLTGDVPTSNKITDTTTSGSFAKDCIIEPLVVQLAKAMLYNITVSTVNWINSGFKGNPGFAQNFRGLLLDTADQVIGRFLEKEAGFLCSSFSFQLRIQLAQTYLPFAERARCTLSDVVRNVNGFVDKNGGIGWDNWIEVTTVPQNNQYGAFVIAQDELSKKIADAQYIDKTYLDWGRGFKDFEVCDAEDEDGKPVCTKSTPGAVVESMLELSLGSGIAQLEVAKDLNAILDALANQVTKQIVTGATGLLGSRKGNKTTVTAATYGSVNYDDAINSKSNDPALEGAIKDSLEETNDSLSTYFTEPDAIDPGDTEPEDDGEVVTPEAQTIELQVLRPQTISVSTTFPYEVDLISNFSASGYQVNMTFMRDGAPYAISNIFNAPQQITYGRSDTYYNTKSINSSTNASILWKPVSVSKNSKYVFKFNGDRRAAAPKGTYTVETTLLDSSGRLVDKKTTDFKFE